jgi:hypothetical protein
MRCVVCLALVLGLVAEARADGDVLDRFEAGRRAYRLGQFDRAISEWTAGYEATGDPMFLFNLAQAHRQRGDRDKALFFYRSFLKTNPESEKNRVSAETAIAELEAMPAPAPPPERVPPFVTDVALFIGLPFGDYDTNMVHASPGVRLSAGYAFSRHVSAHIAFRYVFENTVADYTAKYLDVGAGITLAAPLSRLVSLDATADLVFAHEDIESMTTYGIATGVGLVARAGAMINATPAVAIGLHLAFSSANVSGDFGAIATWLAFEGSVSVRF